LENAERNWDGEDESLSQSGDLNVNNRLQRIADWPAVAAESGYQVEKVAKKYQVSSRTLRRYFLEHFKKTPKHCIDEWRAEAAARELERGEQVKAAASIAKMDDAPNFTRFFKRVEGTTPKKYMHRAVMSENDKKSPKSTRNVRFG
jgi:AraC-like DNA-binding protein